MSSFRSLPLTKGMTAIVDEDDYQAVTAIGRWCFSKNGYAVAYVKNEDGQRTTLYLHRVVYQRLLRQPIPLGMQVDHRNHNRLDNRRLNLRLATRSQNQAHKRRQANNTSQYKGVSFNRGRWEARIRFNGQRINLGRYDDPLQAALIYDAATRLLNQEFAGCNYPDQPTPPEIAEEMRWVLRKQGLK